MVAVFLVVAHVHVGGAGMADGVLLRGFVIFGRPVQATAGNRDGPQSQVALLTPLSAWCLAGCGSDCYARWLCSWSDVDKSDLTACVLAIASLRGALLAALCLFFDGLSFVGGLINSGVGH